MCHLYNCRRSPQAATLKTGSNNAWQNPGMLRQPGCPPHGQGMGPAYLPGQGLSIPGAPWLENSATGATQEPGLLPGAQFGPGSHLQRPPPGQGYLPSGVPYRPEFHPLGIPLGRGYQPPTGPPSQGFSPAGRHMMGRWGGGITLRVSAAGRATLGDLP